MDEIQEAQLKLSIKEEQVKDPEEFVRLLKNAVADNTREAWEAVRTQLQP